METRIAVLAIFVYSEDAVEKINELLHSYSRYIIGRMGLPYRERKISVVSIIMDAPNDIIGALSGKLGAIQEVNVKAVYSKQQAVKE